MLLTLSARYNVISRIEVLLSTLSLLDRCVDMCTLRSTVIISTRSQLRLCTLRYSRHYGGGKSVAVSIQHCSIDDTRVVQSGSMTRLLRGVRLLACLIAHISWYRRHGRTNPCIKRIVDAVSIYRSVMRKSVGRKTTLVSIRKVTRRLHTACIQRFWWRFVAKR